MKQQVRTGKTRLLSVLMAVLMAVSILPGTAAASSEKAADPVPVIYPNVDGKYSYVYRDESIQGGNMYVLMVVEGLYDYSSIKKVSVTEDSLLYMDQCTSYDGEVPFADFLPKQDLDATVFITGSELEAPLLAGHIVEVSEGEEECVVTFDTNGGEKIDPIKVVKGRNLVLATKLPYNEGFTFAGWYFDDKLSEACGDKITITKDVTLYAKWTMNSGTETAENYTVSFETNGGSAIEPVTVASGKELELKDKVPTKPGFICYGWYYDAEFKTFCGSSIVVNTNMTLYAKWTDSGEDPFEVGEWGDIVKEDRPSYKTGTDGIWIADIADIPYTGTAVKPTIHIYKGKTMLAPGTDYTVKYSNNKNVSSSAKGAVTVTFKGEYKAEGSKTVNFSIVPKNMNDPSMIVSLTDAYIAKKIGKPSLKITVKNGSKSLKKNKDYSVEIYNEAGTAAVSDWSAVGTYKVTVKGASPNYTGELQGLELKVGDGSKTPSDKLKVICAKKAVCTGSEITFNDIKVRQGKEELTKNRDYTVSYQNNIWPGVAAVKIQCTGDKYFGSKVVTFKIAEKPMKNAKVDAASFSKKVKLSEGGRQDKVVLTYGKAKAKLQAGPKGDYIAVYSNNSKKGKATVTFVGLRAYTGYMKKTYKITE